MKLDLAKPRDVEKTLLPHVYGWVPFNENPPGSDCEIDNAIYDTPGYDGKKYQHVQDEYKELQYELANGVFNPYVQLVHSKPYLDMPNAYAFSIDDVVGNMDTTGNGLVFTVGGAKGLPNPAPFDRSKLVNVILAPANVPDEPQRPSWVEYGFCAVIDVKHCSVRTPVGGLDLTLPLLTVTYPTAVTLLDASGREYKFEIMKGPPYKEGEPGVIKCLNLEQEWCKYIVARTDDKTNPKLPTNAVQTRAPLPSQ